MKDQVYSQVITKVAATEKIGTVYIDHPAVPLLIDGEEVFIKAGTVAVDGSARDNQKTEKADNFTQWALLQNLQNGDIEQALNIVNNTRPVFGTDEQINEAQ